VVIPEKAGIQCLLTNVAGFPLGRSSKLRPRLVFAGTTGLRIVHESNRFVSVPTPSMTMLTVLPGFIDPTPTDVPQAMTSPASSVMSCEMRLTNLTGSKMMSDQ
jgi:hypothetical protein